MAQRSATARSKLDKITAANGNPPTSPQHARKPTFGGLHHGGARLGSGGLLTPSASSVSGSSTRNSMQLHPPQRVGKGALRSFFDAQGEKLRGRLAYGHARKESDGATNFYAGLGGGVGRNAGAGAGAGFGLGSLSTIGEERVPVNKWEGGGSRGELWDGGGSGKRDLELWYPDGDTLIYLSERPLGSRSPQGLYRPANPQPSFRLRSSVLRSTESPYLISLLEESVRNRPPTPASTLPGTEDEIFPVNQTEEQLMDYEYQLRRARTLELQSSAASSHTQSTARTDSTEAGITYRLYFPAPSRLDKVMRHRFHLTTRNFFAMLFDKPLVGVTFGQTLVDLTERTDKYLSTPSPMDYEFGDRGLGEVESPFGSFLTPGTAGSSSGNRSQQQNHPNTQRMIVDYLTGREFNDVRNWPEGAAGLIVWTEHAIKQNNLSALDEHRLEVLWREGFVHCTGQLSSLQPLPEWREISPITKALIDRASLEIQVRVSNADARISGFNFHDMWPVTSAGTPQARLAFDRFQKFLTKHYASRFGAWPPGENKITRTLYLHLQRDFGTLYSYLVDREAVWSPAHDQPVTTARRTIIKPSNPNWRADDETFPMTDILNSFDERENHPPMPHPFPLVPAPNSSITITQNPPKKQQRFFGNAGPRHRSLTSPGAAQALLSLSESTNIDALRSSTTSNPLLEAFQAHEKSIPAHEISPHDARKGRWIMIYGVLQTLATVAVDAPGVQWSDGVEYWLNPKLRGTPPWKSPPPMSEDGLDERSHFRSYCWVSGAPEMPSPVVTAVPSFTSLAAQRRMRQRSRSRSRKQLKALHRERSDASLPAMAMSLASPLSPTRSRKQDHSSGDEGDDEMDGSESPPPALRTWGARHTKPDGQGVVRGEVAPWEKET